MDGTIFFGSTGQRDKIIDKTFIKGFLTIQDRFRFENNIPAGKAKRRDLSGSGSR